METNPAYYFQMAAILGVMLILNYIWNKNNRKPK
jgi:hypothetical protein